MPVDPPPVPPPPGDLRRCPLRFELRSELAPARLDKPAWGPFSSAVCGRLVHPPAGAQVHDPKQKQVKVYNRTGPGENGTAPRFCTFYSEATVVHN